MYRQKTASFKFYPSEKEIQKFISEDELGGGAPKNRSRERCVTMTDLWVATTRAPYHHTAYQWILEYLWTGKGAKQTKKHKQQEAMRT